MPHIPLKRISLIALALICAVGSIAGIARALHRQTPAFVQVTNQTGGTIGGISAWIPQTWSFESSGDVLNNGNASPQIFVYRHDLRILGGAFAVTQLTCGPVNATNPSISKRNQLVVFEADGGLCADTRHNCVVAPAPNPLPGTRQVFLWNPSSGQIMQITRCVGGCTNPKINGNGRIVLFESTDNLIAGINTGGVPNLYQGDLRRLGPICPQLPCASGAAKNGLRLVTMDANGQPIGGHNGDQSASGRVVLFESSADPLGLNPSGAQQIFHVDQQRRGNVLRQLTSGANDSRAPSTSQSGRIVAYEQDIPFNGNGPLVSQIFVTKLRRKDAKLTQVTNGPFDSSDASIDPLGRRLAFLSSSDGSTKQAFVTHLFRNQVTQISAGPTGVHSPETTTGVFLGFGSSDDFVSNGNNTPQFFVANFFPDPPPGLAPPPGTPTPNPPVPTPTLTPIVGEPKNIGMALVVAEAANNGDNTLTTVIAATVGDFLGNAVSNGTEVFFSIEAPTGGVVVSNGKTNADPDCDVSTFEAQTGVTILNRPGVAHVCLTYPGAHAGTTRTVHARSGPKKCVGGSTPGALCADDSECLPIGLCSNSIDRTCLVDANCPIGGVCEFHEATCQHPANGTGEMLLPLPDNECFVNDQPCSDYNPCTVGDICAGGTTDRVCLSGSHEGQPCTTDQGCPPLHACIGGSNHGQPCTSALDCFPDASGPGECQLVSAGGDCELVNAPTCQPGTPVECPDDGNACTEDVCNFFTGTCGMPKECADDNNPCTDDVCDPATGECGIFNTVPCDDGDPCTVDNVCLDGVCQSGNPMTCPDDSNSCTLDECNPTTGECGIRFEPCACSAPAIP